MGVYCESAMAYLISLLLLSTPPRTYCVADGTTLAETHTRLACVEPAAARLWRQLTPMVDPAVWAGANFMMDGSVSFPSLGVTVKVGPVSPSCPALPPRCGVTAGAPNA